MDNMRVVRVIREWDRLFQRSSGLRRRIYQNFFPLLSWRRAAEVGIGEDIEIAVVVYGRTRMRGLRFAWGPILQWVYPERSASEVVEDIPLLFLQC